MLGAASGIGLATAKLMAKKGWKVHGVDVNEEGLSQLETWATIENVAVTIHITDLSSLAGCQSLVESLNSLDALVNCAGVAVQAPVIGTSEQQMQLQSDVNIMAPLRLMRFCLPLLLDSKGVIVNVSSIAGHVGWTWQGIYSATKFAMDGATDSFRREVLANSLPVRVVKVQPGPVDTPLVHAVQGGLQRWVKNNPNHPMVNGMKRCGDTMVKANNFIDTSHASISVKPEDVAMAIMVACIDDSPPAQYTVISPGFNILFLLLKHSPTPIADLLFTYSGM